LQPVSILDRFRLDGKTALVTGAEGGLGYVNGEILIVDGGWMAR
jgi:hypothetical protein